MRRLQAAAVVGKFVGLAEIAVQIRDSPMDWGRKFDLIFSRDIAGKITETGVRFEWEDPWGTHEEDVRAYVGALSQKASELQSLI